jgi:hypothetical protein
MRQRTGRSAWLAMAATMAAASTMAAEPALFQGSYYQYVPTYTTWDAAKAAAYEMSYEGLPGRLVTITSAAEQAFVSQLLPGNTLVMMGASDAASEGTWVWETGPERGEVFWRNGTAVGGAFTAWRPGEPNAYYPDEDHLAMYNGLWVDSAANRFLHGGYVVEFRSEVHAFDFAMTNDHLGAVRNASPTDRLVGLDLRLAGDTVFDSARTAPGSEYSAWSVIAASPGLTWTLPDSAATDGQSQVSLALDLAPGQSLHLQVDLDRLSLGDSDGIADGTQVTAWFTDGDVRYGLTGVVEAGEMTVLGTSFDHSVHGVSAVAEPATLALWVAGLAALAGWGGRRRTEAANADSAQWKAAGPRSD